MTTHQFEQLLIEQTRDLPQEMLVEIIDFRK